MRQLEGLSSNRMSYNFLKVENFGEFYISYTNDIEEKNLLGMMDSLKIKYHNDRDMKRFYFNTRSNSPFDLLKLFDLIIISDEETIADNKLYLKYYFDILNVAMTSERDYVRPMIPEYKEKSKLQLEIDRFDWCLKRDINVISYCMKGVCDIAYNQEQNIKHGYDKNSKIWRWYI